MNPQTISILLYATAGFIGIAVAYLVSRKSAAPESAQPSQPKPSLFDRLAELAGTRPLPPAVAVPTHVRACLKNGKRGVFRVVSMNRHYVRSDVGGCTMTSRRSRVEFL